MATLAATETPRPLGVVLRLRVWVRDFWGGKAVGVYLLSRGDLEGEVGEDFLG